MAGSSGSDDAEVDCLAASSSDSGEVDYLGGGQRCADCLAASSSDSGEVDYLGGGQRCATAKQRAKQRAHTPGRIAERPFEERRTHADRMLAAKAQKHAAKQDRANMRCTRAHSKQFVRLVLCDAVFALAS